MGSQSRGYGGKLCRLARKRTDPARHHHASRSEFLVVRHRHLEPASVGLDTADLALIQIRHRLALVPPAVINEAIEWNRLRYMIALLASVVVERQCLLGISDVRSPPI